MGSCFGGQIRKVTAAQEVDQGEGPCGNGIVRRLVGDPRKEQKADHVDRLNQVLLDLALTNLPCDPRRQAGHARKGAAQHSQKVIGNEVRIRVATDVFFVARFTFGHGVEHCPPKEDLGDDGQKPHHRNL